MASAAMSSSVQSRSLTPKPDTGGHVAQEYLGGHHRTAHGPRAIFPDYVSSLVRASEVTHREVESGDFALTGDSRLDVGGSLLRFTSDDRTWCVHNPFANANSGPSPHRKYEEPDVSADYGSPRLDTPLLKDSGGPAARCGFHRRAAVLTSPQNGYAQAKPPAARCALMSSINSSRASRLAVEKFGVSLLLRMPIST